MRPLLWTFHQRLFMGGESCKQGHNTRHFFGQHRMSPLLFGGLFTVKKQGDGMDPGVVGRVFLGPGFAEGGHCNASWRGMSIWSIPLLPERGQQPFRPREAPRGVFVVLVS